MQLVEDIAEVVGRVVHTCNVKVAGIVVVEVFRSSIVPNCSKVVPLQQTTLIDENGISVLVAVHDQNGLKTVHLNKKKAHKRPVLYIPTSALTWVVVAKKLKGATLSQKTTIIQYPSKSVLIWF